MSKRMLWSLTLIMSLVLAACGREQITAENIVTKMRATQASTNDLHAVVRLDFVSPEETGFVTAEYWMRKTGTVDAAGNPESAVRFKILDGSAAEMVGSEAVFDGAKGWMYSPSDNTAYVGNKADVENNRPDAESGAGARPTDPTAAVMELQKVVEQGLAAVDIEILGEEQIAGINAYKLRITPKKETQDQLQLPVELLVETTAWIDADRFLPLKFVLDAKEMGKVEAVAQMLELNPGVDAAMFAAQPPAGAKIVPIADRLKDMRGSETAKPATLDEAKAAAGFPVLAPATVPGTSKLVDVQLLEMPKGKAVVQGYSGPGVEWSLVQSQGETAERATNLKGTEVKLRGTTATLIEGSGNVGTLLSWKENGISFVIAGSLSAEEAVAVAESLK